MIISKFSGSSVANVERVKKTVEIIKSLPDRRFVSVSAPEKNPGETGMTDMLYICHSRFMNRENYHEELEKISGVFSRIIDGLGIDFDLKAEIDSIRKNLLSGVNIDFTASRGEYIMAKILAKALGWNFVDASEIIFFNDDGSLNEEKIFAAASAKLKGLDHAVIPSFYGAMPDGKIKTFPRGNGDITGALIARAVNAGLYEKWRNMAEVFTADPAVVENPTPIRNLTYAETLELNYIGIKVVDDSVIFLLQDTDIVLNVRSLQHPEDPGTMITSELPENASRNVAVCISGRKNFNIVHIEKYELNKIAGFGEKLFGLFANYHIACEHCLSSIHKLSVVLKTPTFALKHNEIINDLKKIIKPDRITVEKNLSIIAVIGQGIGPTKGTFAKVFSALSEAGVIVRMIDQGADDLNIIIGVSDSDYEKAVHALYKAVI